MTHNTEYPKNINRYDVRIEMDLWCSTTRSGRPAANAPSDPPPSISTLYQAKPQVRLVWETRPGKIAWSRAKAADRSVPVPFSIPTNAIVARIGKLGDIASAIPPMALNRERITRKDLRPI